MQFRLRFPAAHLGHWSSEYGYRVPDDRPKEIGLRARQRGYLTSAELGELAHWKSPRSAGRCARNSPAFVREVTRAALASREPRFKVEVLRLLDGVDWPTASTLLHFADAGRWPILDFRALWSLRAQVEPSQYCFELWDAYTSYMRKLSDRSGLDMRAVDRALWAYSKEYQKSRAG
jgi:hypothetical protein